MWLPLKSHTHANICSNATLLEEEPESPKKDEQVTLALLEIIEQKKEKTEFKQSELS